MASIIISSPRGIRPKLNPRLLEQNQAQKAENCILESGDIRPLASPKYKQGLSTGTVSIFKNNDSWLEFSEVTSVAQSPVENTNDRYYYTNSSGPKKASDSVSAMNLGVPQPGSGPSLTINGTGDGDIVRSSVYIYTRVTDWDEESAPSKPSGVVDVEGGEYVTFSGLSDNSDSHVTHYRIYRAVAGQADSAYMLVPYQTTAGNIQYDSDNNIIYDIPKGDIGNMEDGLTDDELSITIEVEEWYEPPSDLAQLTDLGNGLFAGITGNEVCFCEPWVPYAWPYAYRYTVNEALVGLGHIEGTTVAFTEKSIYVFDGSRPDSFHQRKLSETQGCVSARSIVNTPGGVFFASRDGLCLVSQNGVEIITRHIWTKEEWNDFSLSSLVGAIYDKAYYGFFSGESGGFVLPLDEADTVTTMSFTGTFYDAHVDHGSDELVLAMENSGRKLYEFDADSDLSFTWKSKVFQVPAINFSCLKILGQSGDLTVTIDVDGTTQVNKSVSINDVIRLPSGFLGNEHEIKVSGTTRWHTLGMATSVEELRQNGL